MRRHTQKPRGGHPPESGSKRRARQDGSRPSSLSHIGPDGASRMVDVGAKESTSRRAVAEAQVRLGAAAARALAAGAVAKGNVLEVARLAGIGAAKRTWELIPLCHQLPIEHVAVDFDLAGTTLRIRTEASAFARTGVEMEALTAAAVAALTVYDMLKSVDKNMRIQSIKLLEKSGGKSGDFRHGASREPGKKPTSHR